MYLKTVPKCQPRHIATPHREALSSKCHMEFHFQNVQQTRARHRECLNIGWVGPCWKHPSRQLVHEVVPCECGREQLFREFVSQMKSLSCWHTSQLDSLLVERFRSEISSLIKLMCQDWLFLWNQKKNEINIHFIIMILK